MVLFLNGCTLKSGYFSNQLLHVPTCLLTMKALLTCSDGPCGTESFVTGGLPWTYFKEWHCGIPSVQHYNNDVVQHYDNDTTSQQQWHNVVKWWKRHNIARMVVQHCNNGGTTLQQRQHNNVRTRDTKILQSQDRAQTGTAPNLMSPASSPASIFQALHKAR